jgi:hypothetical protein
MSEEQGLRSRERGRGHGGTGSGLARLVLDELTHQLAGGVAIGGGRARVVTARPEAGPECLPAAEPVRARLLLPTNYNDGSGVPISEMVAFLRELLDTCASGLTASEASGVAIDDGAVERDDHLVIDIGARDAGTLRRVVSRWTSRLRQRVLCLEFVSGARLEFVPPST